MAAYNLTSQPILHLSGVWTTTCYDTTVATLFSCSSLLCPRYAIVLGFFAVAAETQHKRVWWAPFVSSGGSAGQFWSWTCSYSASADLVQNKVLHRLRLGQIYGTVLRYCGLSMDLPCMLCIGAQPGWSGRLIWLEYMFRYFPQQKPPAESKSPTQKLSAMVVKIDDLVHNHFCTVKPRVQYRCCFYSLNIEVVMSGLGAQCRIAAFDPSNRVVN